MDKRNIEEELKGVKEERDKYKNLFEKAYKELNEYRNVTKINPRGAGRKPKLTDGDIVMIKMYRCQGQTIKELALSFNCSQGLICKVLN